METSLDRAVKRGKLDAADRDSALARITLTSELKDVAGADLVIEAVPEKVELKISIMKTLDEIVGDDAVIASNTSAIPIAQLAGEVRDPGRVLGLHFFSPVPVMALVEIVRALDTSDETVEKARAFVERLGKHAIETKDRSGFIVNFLLIPYLMAAVRMYEEGFASREDIDDGMRLGAGHPMGPLTLCDFIGLDVLHAVCNSLYEEFKARRVRSPARDEAYDRRRASGKKVRPGLLRLPDAGCTRLADGRGLESPGDGRNRQSSSTVSEWFPEHFHVLPSATWKRTGLLPIWPILR